QGRLLTPGPGRHQRRGSRQALRHGRRGDRPADQVEGGEMNTHLKLTIRASRNAIARSGGSVHLLVRAEPPAQPERPERRPVALALVLDRSGSMASAAAARLTAGTRVDSAGDSGVPTKVGY